MVEFLCFYSPVHYLNPKNTVHMATNENQPTKEFTLPTQMLEDTLSNSNETNQSPSSEQLNPENESGPHDARQMMKSLSLGTCLEDYNNETMSHDGCSVDYDASSSHVESLNDNQNTQLCDSLHVNSELVNPESVCSTVESESRFSEGYNSNFPHRVVKSSSLPFFDPPFSASDDQNASKDASNSDAEYERVDNYFTYFDKSTADESSDSCPYVGSAKDWIAPGIDESNKGKNFQDDDLGNKDFKIKWIEKWVMDLHFCPPDDMHGSTSPHNHETTHKVTVLDAPTCSRIEANVHPGMDAVKKCISSLGGSSTSAQLMNHGLVTIPFLGAFKSLKVVNLSGNTIVRITAGILPRRLQVLNLSKNNISVIEGIRELTRLRVLDLSYNRILRIGRGLAHCLSMRELYLAGNKISEVEGLHRLLKLIVLDLRFNKLSTTKSLGQLAANYNSLQAIGLEGNPAQKNIGDESLKKYLTGLLPHLVYFNRKLIKPSAVKDPADRAARLGISDHGRQKSKGGRKSQRVSSRSRHVRLPPSGMKTDRHHFHDSSGKPPPSGFVVSIRRTQSEGVLRAF